ncbi:MAG: efflux RND transporter periplasmic adaptor subunit [Rhodobacteraceae bacterium]|jgi:HlyD family secretion protein|nr:efflux RND transporter periplasmic adaptor subunit [Paracoccaceae bacterium]
MRGDVLGLGLLMMMTAAVLPQGLRADTAEAGATDAAPAAVAEVLPAITVSTVAAMALKDRVIVSGLIGPVERVQVAPLIEGQPIETLQADVGDLVAAGQVLATLSKTTLELQLSQTNASLASARATIAQAEAQMLEARSAADEAVRVNERTAALREQGAASQAAADTAAANAISATARVTVAAQSLEAARAQVALVEAQMANAELSLQRTQVVAPVAGEVVERNATLGSVATAAGQPMFVIVKNNELELRGDVAEVDLLRLSVGQPASLRLVGVAEPLVGTVRLVEPSIDATTRLGRVRISIAEGANVRSGMFAEAEIIVGESLAPAIPATALGSAEGQPAVMKVTDGMVSRVTVTPGIRDGAMVEILQGLAIGDMVVTKAGAFVRDGDRINPVTATSN